MDKASVEIAAADKLIDALDRYKTCFDAMVLANLDVALYEDVGACLADIREAKGVIFSQVASASVDFVMAHTSLMTSLWNAQLSRIRGDKVPYFDAHNETMRAEHDEAIEQLRAACERVRKGRRVPTAPRPSPPPDAGR